MGKLAEKEGCKPASELILPITVSCFPTVRFSAAAAGSGNPPFFPLPFTSVLPLLFLKKKESILKPQKIGSSAALGQISPLLPLVLSSLLIHPFLPRHIPKPLTEQCPGCGAYRRSKGDPPHGQRGAVLLQWDVLVRDTVPALSSLHLNAGKTTCR